jgi:hypothetical protein
VYQIRNLNYAKTKPECWINHNRGEGSITIKSNLASNLAYKMPFMGSVYPMYSSDPQGLGCESFLPKCFEIGAENGPDNFFHYYFYT